MTRTCGRRLVADGVTRPSADPLHAAFRLVGTLPGAFQHQRLGKVDALVQIENQLEQTDQSHLGQIFT